MVTALQEENRHLTAVQARLAQQQASASLNAYDYGGDDAMAVSAMAQQLAMADVVAASELGGRVAGLEERCVLLTNQKRQLEQRLDDVIQRFAEEFGVNPATVLGPELLGKVRRAWL